MISKVSVLILGIIGEKPVNPYEITKMLEQMNVKSWFPVAASSIYVTIKKLKQKGYITGEIVKEGNMPEKTVYSLTQKGKEVLSQTLIEFLLDTELDLLKFNIACILLCHLGKDEALNVLKKRLSSLKWYKNGAEKHYSQMKDSNSLPYPQLTVILHHVYLMEAEIKITEEIVTKVENDNDWNYFLATGQNI